MTTLLQAIRVLENKATEDPALAEALCYLAVGSAGPVDPFADPGTSVRIAARTVNERRQREHAAQQMRHALGTSEVVELIDSINDRRGVDRRRHRGQLLGWRAGRATLHPEWQFDRRRGDTHEGLERVIAALAEVTTDARAADLLMTTPRGDLDGGTLADLLARGRVETTVRLVLSSGDQS
ncbi:MAG TPA: hypothetical protein VLG28_11025 [Acidimicrobiia bacterium]|jgi:hypothetical protein|nr:hypothetical protein [Acidimicrobiia bacterium]